jgi:hypothetical protein
MIAGPAANRFSCQQLPQTLQPSDFVVFAAGEYPEFIHYEGIRL